MIRVYRTQVVAFRLSGHNLHARLPPGSIVEAAAACGIQDTPPGSAALALHARVTGLTADAVDPALTVDKTLLEAATSTTPPQPSTRMDRRPRAMTKTRPRASPRIRPSPWRHRAYRRGRASAR